ncbi:MAG: carbohydrate kinase [Pseudomonadota bacterium]
MILCCGEALIDMLPRDTAFAPHAGGAVFNTAIALGRLGVPTGFFSGLSTDLFGTVLDDALKASNVDASLAARSDRPTTLAFVTLTDGQAQYAFYDENTAGRMLAPEDLPDLPVSVSACFFGGISLAVEPCANAYAALQEQVCADTVTMLDPNVRPGFIRDEAVYRRRIEGMIARSDILKLSDEDLRWLQGEGDIDTLAAGMLSRGPSVVFITEGAKGARAYTKATAQTHEITSEVTVVDTVGAGDTFNAGVLASLHNAGLLTKAALPSLDAAALAAALSLGARTAAVTVSRAGANPPWSHEL